MKNNVTRTTQSVVTTQNLALSLFYSEVCMILEHAESSKVNSE